MNRRLILVLVASCGMAVTGGLAQAQDAPPQKVAVRSADDLPRHSYTIEGKASEFLLSDAPFKAFMAKVKADVEGDLAKYDIQDKATLQQYLGLLQSVAMIEGRLDDAAAYVEQIKSVETKESKKLMAGHVLASIIAGRKAGKDQFEATFKRELNARVSALPWTVVREDVLQARGRSQIMRRELLMGSMAAQLDPVVAQLNGQITNEIAWPLVSVRASVDVMLDLQPMIAEVYTTIIDAKEAGVAPAKDIWSPNEIALSDKDVVKPVVVGIWDSGVDVPIFKGRLFVNAAETMNGKDDDANGFVDDVNGIAYDLHANAIPELLHPTGEMTNDLTLVTQHTKGFLDLQAGVESPEAGALRAHMGAITQENVKGFLEDLSLYGNYSHGTHVAGIAAEGNPGIRILPARITFDFRMIPTVTPSVEQAKKEAKAALDTVAYFRKAGVRVVNMSWGGDRKSIEVALEQKGVGSSPEERAAMSREIFAIQRDALDQAMRGAPEILFVAAAGNSDNDNEFAELIPSGLSLPNMMTVGAIDRSGKPTSFTTFGKNVTLYANGFEVNSYVPGGQKMKFSGTSMAAPNAANVAAKMLAVNPELTTQQLIDLISAGADPMPGQEGRFIINPRKSVEMARQAGNK
ncbi:MAG: S8 family serine peptidase [Phycisphaerales bacterium]|nr:S8 family serine peptidase [Phycisphaerales bacterium]